MICFRRLYRTVSNVRNILFVFTITIIVVNVLHRLSWSYSNITLQELYHNSRRRLNINYELGNRGNVSRQNVTSLIQPRFRPVSQLKKDVLSRYRAGERTGNHLIDDYGRNDLSMPGEMGKPVVWGISESEKVATVMSKFHVNTVVSDRIPLNRMVPDSRIVGCDSLQYDTTKLGQASVIVPFHDEWPSLLLRTVYSIINRSPRENIREIILVDDASTLLELQDNLDKYIKENFPEGLVHIVRINERVGLTQARMRGSQIAAGDVLIFFDSHMEVNINWLPPLLTEVARDKKVVAMATLDYIKAETFQYEFNVNYLTRYAWTWTMVFFETFFRQDQIGADPRATRVGVTMVGPAYAIDRDYFNELGGYDSEMKVWGGENIEMSWRVWMCGGRLLHVPCSRVGHVARGQPYTFPGGRTQIEHYNYKRAALVWMGNYTRFLYSIYPDMKTLDVGDLSERLALKTKLGCKDFSWYLQNIWPELNVYDVNATLWGQVRNEGTGLCLDNNGYLFQAPAPLYLQPCAQILHQQVFSLSADGRLKTTLQCVVCHHAKDDAPVLLEDCIIGSRDLWTYKDKQLIHARSGLCLEVFSNRPVLRRCSQSNLHQRWDFLPYSLQ
ncbi:polypeptide N-acetylgalactosaminyltransferase 1-like [Physella acuta]|uniref:polypeptide N-acetylgalactosaminyltransferase 1-like n=1 Tax=Physella acuta TaxID=109671 RepID=UPI0027DE6335|nr:polypeptide N-acetylgalactosaminyltransferase 1-like [Physella acuta]